MKRRERPTDTLFTEDVLPLGGGGGLVHDLEANGAVFVLQGVDWESCW